MLTHIHLDFTGLFLEAMQNLNVEEAYNENQSSTTRRDSLINYLLYLETNQLHKSCMMHSCRHVLI